MYVCAIQATLNSFPHLHFSTLICFGIYNVIWYRDMCSSGRIKYIGEWSHGAVCKCVKYGYTRFIFVKTYHTFPDCNEYTEVTGGSCGLKSLASPKLLFTWIVFISVRSWWIIDWSAFISFSLIAIKFCKLSTVDVLLQCFE